MCFYDTVILGLVAINSIQDIRKREILLLPTLFIAVLGIVIKVVTGESILNILVAFAPGAFLILCALLTRGRVGLGDGIVLTAAGAWKSLEFILHALVYGLFAAAIAAIVCIIRGKKDFPFVPFLAVGFVVAIGKAHSP